MFSLFYSGWKGGWDGGWKGGWKCRGDTPAALTLALLRGKSIHPAALAWRPACWRRTRRGLSSAPFAWGRLLPALFASARAWVHWALNRPQNCSGTPGGKNQAAAPLGRWRLPRAHFKNHFENRPSPSPAHKRPSTPGGPISTNARGEPHPSGAPYKKPNPNSRFFGVAQRPDTPLRFRFHALQESPAVKRPRPVSFDWPFHFSIFPPKIGTFFTPPLFQAPNPSRYVR